MYNSKRTLEIFGYDLENQKRRSKEEVTSTGNIRPRLMLVVDNCPQCNTERQIKLNQSRKNKPCLKCFHSSDKMKQIKLAQKGKIFTEEHKQNMRASHWSNKGITSPFKGKTHTKESKEIISDKQKTYMEKLSSSDKKQRYIKSSTTFRGIDEQDFNGWATEESARIRGSSEYKNWENSVLSRDKHCQYPGCLERRRVALTAHHKDGFNWAIQRRFDTTNGVTLCKYHHNKGPNSFHSTYGNGDNTDAQFNEWIGNNTIKATKKRKLFLVTGAPGSGKSWVCSQLAQIADYIPYDDTPKEQHLLLMLIDRDVPIIYDPWRKASSFVKRYSSLFEIEFIVITETLDVLSARLISRGGTVDDNTKKYCSRAFNIAKKATFSGSSQEVLDFIKSKLKSSYISKDKCIV